MYNMYKLQINICKSVLFMVAMATVPMATRPSFSEAQHCILCHLSKCSLNHCISYGNISGINIYALIQHLTPFPSRMYFLYTLLMTGNPLNKDILKDAKPRCVPEDPIHMCNKLFSAGDFFSPPSSAFRILKSKSTGAMSGLW